MRVVVIRPGSPLPAGQPSLVGSVLARDLAIAGDRWSKGRRLSAGDLACLVGTAAEPVTLLVAEEGDVHEDEAAARLAALVGGPGLTSRGPAASRIDLVATAAGEVRVRTAALERLDAIDGLSVFSLLDGQLVAAGTMVASVKTGPHVVTGASLGRAAAVVAGRPPVIDVRPFRPARVAAVVKESIAGAARTRFESTLEAKMRGLGCSLVHACYVPDDPAAIAAALRPLVRGPSVVDIVLTAGAPSTDPADSMFVAFAAVGGRVTSHGVPAHPGSMLWLGVAGRTAVLGLPSCGAYSRAGAADLLLPWLVAGEPPTRRTVARLGHGGLLTRDMRFRFPPYARELTAPEG